MNVITQLFGCIKLSESSPLETREINIRDIQDVSRSAKGDRFLVWFRFGGGTWLSRQDIADDRSFEKLQALVKFTWKSGQEP